MESGDYYLNESLDNSGVAKTKGLRSPLTEQNTSNSSVFNISPRSKNVGQYFNTSSQMDGTMGGVPEVLEEFDNINNFRADKQGTFDRIGNALVNNITIAGTTAVGGILGLTEGIFSAAANKDISKLWDNNINKAALDIQSAMQESFPIYQGDDYKNKSIWQKLGTDIFWANAIQTLGYTEGMLVPGMAIGKAVSSAPTIIKTVLPSLTASIGEASVEAISNKEDQESQKKQVALDGYNKLLSEAKTPLDRSILSNDYLSELQTIEEDAIKSGNFIFGSNIALLTLSNTIQFGNIFSRGYNTSRKLANNLKRSGEGFSGLNTTKEVAKGVGRGTLNALSEGIEEVSQGVIARAPSLYKDYNLFNESKFNLDKRELVADMWSALGQSLSESMKDPNTAEEFASGFIIGALGMPMLKKGIVPIKFEGGIHGEIGDHIKEAKRSQELANSINNRINDSKEMQSYYNGLVRNLALQDQANTALDNYDNFEYNNANSAKLISDIMMFDDAGHIDYLKDLVNKSVDYSPEGLNSIIQETSKDGSGPFMTNGNPMDHAEVSDILKRKTGGLLAKIDSYTKDKESLYTIASPELSESSLQSALYIKSQLRDWDSRATDIADKVSKAYNSLSEENDIPSNLFRNITTKESKLIKDIDNVLQELPQDEYESMSNKLADLSKINEAVIQYKTDLRDILINPTKSNTREDKVIENSSKKNIDKKSDNLKSKLSEVDSVPFFRETLNEETDSVIRDNALNNLIEEGNSIATQTKEIDLINKKLLTKIEDSQLDDSIKEDAIKLLDNVYNNAESTEDISSESVNADPQLIYDESLTVEDNTKKFTEAIYLLETAIDNVNEDNKFIDKFELGSAGISSSIDQKVGSTNGEVDNLLIDDITIDTPFTELIEDNSKQDSNDVPTSKSKNYYRPALPEIHIEYSKKQSNDMPADFRPFNVVVKERSNLDFDTLYNYLNDNGAFSYVNEGKLKQGSVIGFMIDPYLEDQMKSYTWYKGPTILMIDKSNNQIVGSLDESQYSVDTFVGLANLRKAIKTEYSNTNQSDKFISNITTNVAQIMVGKVPYNLIEKDLSTVPNVTDSSIFGIIKNGEFITNESIPVNSIVRIDNISNKEGRLYLLIPNAKGEHTPSLLKVKHFNHTDFNINDPAIQSTPLYTDIYNATELIATSSSREELADGYKALNRELYLRNIHIDMYNTETSQGVRVIKVELDKQGKEIYEEIDGRKIRKETVKIINFTDRTTEYRIKTILDNLLDLNLLIRVDTKKINTPGYNNKLISSNILTTNITNAKSIGSWFTTYTVDKDNKIDTTYIKLSSKDVPSKDSTTKLINTESVIVGNDSYFVDTTKGEIYNSNGLQTKPKNSSLILDIAWANSNFGNKTNSNIMVDNKILLPNGKVLDRDTNIYLNEELSNEFKDKLNKLNKETNKSLPIFNSNLEKQVRINRTSSDFNLDKGELGYYIEDGEIVKGYLTKILTHENNDVFITKVPIYTKGKDNLNKVAYNMYYAVFSNGKSALIVKNDSSRSQVEIESVIIDTLLKNPNKIKSISEEGSLLTSNKDKPSKVIAAIQVEDKVNNKNITRVARKLPSARGDKSIKVNMDNNNLSSISQPISDITFTDISTEIKDMLIKKGWTETKFNSISQEERKQLLDCVYL